MIGGVRIVRLSCFCWLVSLSLSISLSLSLSLAPGLEFIVYIPRYRYVSGMDVAVVRKASSTVHRSCACVGKRAARRDSVLACRQTVTVVRSCLGQPLSFCVAA